LIEEEERATTRVSRRTSFSEFYHLQDEYGNRVELEDLNLCKGGKKRTRSARSERDAVKSNEIQQQIKERKASMKLAQVKWRRRPLKKPVIPQVVVQLNKLVDSRTSLRRPVSHSNRSNRSKEASKRTLEEIRQQSSSRNRKSALNVAAVP
jgi:hypothetical protein